MGNTLTELSNELAGIVQGLSPFVVSVRARRHYPSSGFLWSNGVVVTADHTIQRDEDITVTLADGKTVGAALAGRDPGSDLAVLTAEGATRAGAGPGHAEAVKAGELALVLGRSPDSGANASLGIVSAASGPWRTWRGGKLEAYIRLDARLFPQSSGGVAVNAQGKIIGIATSDLSRVAGVAIPVADVRRVTGRLLEKGFMPRGYLGVGIQPIPIPEELQRKLSVSNKGGLIILTVESGSPADKAGLLIGDILTAVGDSLVERPGDLQKFTDPGCIGKAVRIRFIRGGASSETILTVVERPEGRG